MRALAIAALVFAAAASQAQAACGRESVYLFSAYWCPACRAAEEFLQQHNVAYQRFEVTDNPRVQQFMRVEFGSTAIPVIVVDGNHRLGYDAGWLLDELCLY